MTNAMTVHGSTALASAGDFGEEHKRVVKDAFCAGATDLEFALLWQGAKSRGLDPVRKQIHFVKRRDDMRGCDVWSSQVSIDGFRSIAEGTGRYDGQDEPEYEMDPEGGGVLVARVKVYKKGVGRPFVGVARWEEFAGLKRDGSPTYMWAKMPFHMLAKCAEALALRKAFPEELCGLYAPEEMGGAPTIVESADPEAGLVEAIAEAVASGVLAAEEKQPAGYKQARARLISWCEGHGIAKGRTGLALAQFKDRVAEVVGPKPQSEPAAQPAAEPGAA